jgi:AsmA protein
LRFGPGTITGMDLSTLIKRAERNPVEALLEARGGRTAIESATGTFRIMDGKATTDNFLVRGAGYQIAIKGGTDVATRNLSFNGALSGAASESGKPGLELPFVIRGPWSDPIVVPNPEALMRRNAN